MNKQTNKQISDNQLVSDFPPFSQNNVIFGKTYEFLKSF